MPSDVLESNVKKTLSHPKANPEARKAFTEKINTYQKAGRALIYIDESGFAEDMPRTHGYSPKGQRCYGTHDWPVHKRTNVIGALQNNDLITLCAFQGNIDSKIFDAWVAQDLLPKLPESSVIVMDNAAFHKPLDIQQRIQQAGHSLEYLPAYSPDLNPIELKWAHAKALRRKYRCDIDTLFKTLFQ